MDILRKNLALKVGLLVYAGFLMTLGIRSLVAEDLGLILAMVVFGIWLISVMVWMIWMPFRKLVQEIKFILTGRKYRKILTKRYDEIGIFSHFYNEVTSTFEAVSGKIREGVKVSSELKLAGELQKELLPSSLPSIDGLKIVIRNRPAEELGGDNFDCIVTDEFMYFYVGDVTGHGVPAAIIMTMVNTLINAFSEMKLPVCEVVSQTNFRLKKRIRASFFMSMVLLKWDIKLKKLSFVGCGHEYILIYRVKTGEVEAKLTGGIALGMVADNSKIIKEQDLDVAEGDLIILYTDGVTEAKNMQGEMFGLERLKGLVGKYAGLMEAEGVVASIAKEFSHFVEEHVQEDDITLVAIKVGSNGKVEDGKIMDLDK